MNSTEKNIKKIIEILRKEFPDETQFDAPLAQFTSYNVGGNADLLVFPKSVDHVERIIHL